MGDGGACPTCGAAMVYVDGKWRCSDRLCGGCVQCGGPIEIGAANNMFCVGCLESPMEWRKMKDDTSGPFS
jgi:hypothetical protein